MAPKPGLAVHHEQADVEAEQLRLLSARADKEEALAARYKLDNARIRRELVETARVREALETYAHRVQSTFRRLPAQRSDELMGRLQITGEQSRHKLRVALTEFVDAALNEIAAHAPK